MTITRERLKEIREKSLPREYCPASWVHELLDEIEVLKEGLEEQAGRINEYMDLYSKELKKNKEKV